MLIPTISKLETLTAQETNLNQSPDTDSYIPEKFFSGMILNRLHENVSSSRFRSRFATASDITTFVVYSDNEKAITNAHQGLKGDERYLLYKKWFDRTSMASLSGDTISTSFAILEDAVTAKAISISIVLPLTEAGNDTFCDSKHSVTAVDLEDEAISQGKSRNVLLDTWITGRRGGDGERVYLGKWGILHFQKHLGAVWNFNEDGTHSFLCEPAAESVARLLLNAEFSKFERPRQLPLFHKNFIISDLPSLGNHELLSLITQIKHAANSRYNDLNPDTY